jgi:hypothetical protein
MPRGRRATGMELLCFFAATSITSTCEPSSALT